MKRPETPEEMRAYYINVLKMTPEQADEAIEDDYIINHGGRCEWEPTIEEERKLNKVRGDRKKETAPRKPREKKVDTVKQDLVKKIAEAVGGEITNPERMVAFTLDGEDYEVTLVRKRKPKN